MKDWMKLVLSVLGCELVGIISTTFTISSISSWYIYLNKPSFAPPNRIFGPVWVVLYMLMGISIYLIWKQGWKKKKVREAGKTFLVQLGLNFLWSPIFFGLRSPILGFVFILILWAFIIVTMKKFYPLSKLAFGLLIPYLLWVSFASILNGSIVILNR